MNWSRFVAAVVLVAALAIPAQAEKISPDAWRYLAQAAPIAQTAPNIAPGTTVSTTGPVTSSTQIDVGSIASSAFAWAATAALGVVVPFIVKLLLAVAARFGQATTDALRARFTEFVTNGANLLVAAGAERLRGLSPIEVKGAILADLVRYVQAHGAETVKKLGVDPQSPKLVEAVQAQLETAITNPAVPTATALSPRPAEVTATFVPSSPSRTR